MVKGPALYLLEAKINGEKEIWDVDGVSVEDVAEGTCVWVPGAHAPAVSERVQYDVGDLYESGVMWSLHEG